jgi:L-ascorbate metabolism protein UlaG (beta-lactamase superfamily)
MSLVTRYLAVLVLMAAAPTGPALAAGCFPIAAAPPRVVPAVFRQAAIPAGATVQLTFLGHSSFLIETAEGVTAVTDYNGYAGLGVTPDVVTMNNAHGTHYTDHPDPSIQHVLRGWSSTGGMTHHDLLLEDLRVRNVPTSVHGRVGDQANSNSIFVFEVADLCIAHLGHLHHVLTDVHLKELGLIDVLLVPIDGAYTMAQELMVQVIEQIRPSLVIPMHYFGPHLVARFVALMEERWAIETRDEPVVALSRATLPQKTVLVLPGY